MNFKKVLSFILAVCMLLTFTACSKSQTETAQPDAEKAPEAPVVEDKVEFLENVPGASDEMRTYASSNLPDLAFYGQVEVSAKVLENKYENVKTAVFAQEGWFVDCESNNSTKPYTYTIKITKDDTVRMLHYVMNLNDEGLLDHIGTYDENGVRLSTDELNERFENLF